MADIERQTEVHSVSDLLDEIENENLYRALLAVDKRTLQIVLLKMQGYSTCLLYTSAISRGKIFSPRSVPLPTR